MAHIQHTFTSPIAQYAYFKDSTVSTFHAIQRLVLIITQTILVRLHDQTVWQSSNEGYHWQEAVPGKKFLAFYHHKYSNDRAFLISATNEYYYTTNTGGNWYVAHAENGPNAFGAQVMQFHPTQTDYLIWVGNKDCTASGGGSKCRAEAHYTTDNGRRWYPIDDFVRNCAFARDSQLDADPKEIVCEAYRDKNAPQPKRPGGSNPLGLVVGSNFYARKQTIFESVVGFAKFSEFFVVAEVCFFGHL